MTEITWQKHIRGDSSIGDRELTAVDRGGWIFWKNKNGYRSRIGQHTWDNDMDSSIVAIGCSQMLGVGLNWEDTLCGLMESQMNVQVVSLAKSGTGVEYVWQQVMRILELEVKPLAFVINWSDPSRWLDFTNDKSHVPAGKLTSYGNWMKDATHYDKWVFDNPQWSYLRALEIIRSTHHMAGSIPIIDFTWNHHYQKNYRAGAPHLIQQVDQISKHDQHWGKKTNLKAYDYVKDQINKLNLRPNFR